MSLPPDLVNGFAVLGFLVALSLGVRFLDFIWIYFLRPSSIRKYLVGPAPYALVTGATDGIGKAIAKELHRKGFNLIIHGRNEAKIHQTIEEIKACGRSNDIRYFVADATAPGHNFHKLLEEFQDLNITLLINNVGGTAVKLARIDEWTDEEITGTVRWNALFPLGITRALLPQLRRSPGPVLVLSVGSFAGDLPPPRVAIYAASKRFMEYLSRGLSMDERYFTPTNVQFMFISVGKVRTNAVNYEPSFVCPDAETYGKCVVHQIGCGRRRLAPYLGHAVSQWFVEAVGEWIGEKIVGEAMRQIFFSQSGHVKED